MLALFYTLLRHMIDSNLFSLSQECPCFAEHGICDEESHTCTCRPGFFGKECQGMWKQN